MKRIYLVRHGKAEDYDSDRHNSDFDRTLTSEGRDQLLRIARKLKRVDKKIEIVLTSPLRRARETAEILGMTLGADVELFGALEPPVSPSRLLAAVRERKEDRLALVGHEPGCGETIARWLGVTSRSIPLKKGGIARLDLLNGDSHSPCELVWIATPDLFGARGGA